MIKSIYHSKYDVYSHKKITHAHLIKNGFWRGEFESGYLFLIDWRCGVLQISVSSDEYSLGSKFYLMGHDEQARKSIKFSEICSYLNWEVNPEYVWDP